MDRTTGTPGHRRRDGALLRRVGRRPAHHAVAAGAGRADGVRRAAVRRRPGPGRHAAAARRRGRPRDRRLDGRALLRLRHRRHVPGRAGQRLAGRARGTRTPRCPSCRRWPPACTTSCGDGWWTCCGCPRTRGWRSSPGATVANAACLAAARDALLARLGWDAQADGLFGAPPFPVVIGERAHSTLAKSLGLVGLGRARVHVVPADDQGRLRADRLPDVAGPVLVCAQAGEVNTGAFDPFDAIADWLAERGGWLHVDGAFGLWALADPTRAALVAGLDRADSWATDGHKWLNVALRLRPRLRARPRRPAAHVRRDRGLPARRATGSRRCTTRRSRRSGPGRWRCGRCCARSGGAASPSWSSGPAPRPGRSPTRWPRAG